MVLNKEILTKVIKQAKKVQKELEKLNQILEPVNDVYTAIDPLPFYMSSDVLPEIRAIMGGTMKVRKCLFQEGSYEAELIVDGVKFRNYCVAAADKERYHDDTL